MRLRRAGIITGLCLLMATATPGWAKTEEEYQEEIRALQKRNTQLENKLEEAGAELKRASTQLELLQNKIAQTASEGSDNAKELKDARDAMKQLKAQMQTLLEQQNNAETAQKTKELEAQLNKALQQARDAEQKLKAAEKEKSALQQDAAKASATKDADAQTKKLQQNIELLQSQMKTQQQDFSDQQQRLREELQKVQSDYELQKTQYKTNLATLQEKEQELQTLRQKGDAASADDPRVGELEAMLAQMNEKVVKLSQEKTALETQLKAQIASQTATTGTAAKEQLKSAELEQEVARLQGLLDAATQQSARQDNSSQEADARVAELETQLKQANARAEEMSAENARLETQLRDAQAIRQDDVTQTQSEVSRLKGELRKAAEYMNIKNTELLAAKEENSRLTAQIAAHEQQQTSLQTAQSSELQQQSVTVQQLQTRFDEAQATLEQSKREIASLIDERDRLSNNVEAVKSQNAMLQEELANREQQFARQTSVPEEAKKRIEELTAELRTAKIKLDALSRMEAEYLTTQKELADMKIELASLRKTYGEAEVLRPELQELKLQLDRARQEAETAAARSETLQQNLAGKAETYQRQQREYDEISARHRELEEQYQKGLADLQVKEKLLQQVLLEKTVLEKVVDDEDLTSASVLKVKLQDAEKRNADLQAQLASLQVAQTLPTETKDVKPPQPSGLSTEVTQRFATLEGQLIEERAKRQQLESELQTARQQLISVKTVKKETTPAVSSGTAFFPSDMLKSAAGGLINILSWSNDRKKIAYIESTPKAEFLWIMDTQTRQSSKITEWQKISAAPRLTRCVWAFDNQHFLFSSGEPGQFMLYVGDSNRLIGTPIQIPDQTISYAWSPNQLQFAYFSGSQLMIQTLQGEVTPFQIGHKPGTLPSTLAWSPDGSKIAFSARKDSSMDVFLLSFSDRTPVLQPLVASPSEDILPSWSPDGMNIAFYVQSNNLDAKIAVTPADKSRSPYIVAHNVSLPASRGPQWMNAVTVQYIGEETMSASQNSLYRVDIKTGQRSSVPLAMMVGE